LQSVLIQGGMLTTAVDVFSKLAQVSVLTVRDGLIARYRDYWNPLRSAE
jgi:ketosteroid isomerase-like protein